MSLTRGRFGCIHSPNKSTSQGKKMQFESEAVNANAESTEFWLQKVGWIVSKKYQCAFISQKGGFKLAVSIYEWFFWLNLRLWAKNVAKGVDWKMGGYGVISWRKLMSRPFCTTTAKQQHFMTDRVMKYGPILHASINVARAVCSLTLIDSYRVKVSRKVKMTKR